MHIFSHENPFSSKKVFLSLAFMLRVERGKKQKRIGKIYEIAKATKILYTNIPKNMKPYLLRCQNFPTNNNGVDFASRFYKMHPLYHRV